MSSKGLKPAIARPSARDALAAAATVAQQAGLPPAALSPRHSSPAPTLSPTGDELVQLNIRVRRGLGDQLADRARAEGTTQKVLVCRALQAAGFDVHPEDLRVTPPPRRRGNA
jgi:ABC-type branched-subunit amino acid transport system substrate-binding protein